MCGKRLNDWKTIPISRRMRFTSTPRAVTSSPATDDASRVDRLEDVHAAQERRLPGARGADEAHDLVLGEREVDPAQDLELAERLVDALELECGRRAHASLPACCRRRSRATSQSVNRASGIVIATKSVAATR